MTDKMQRLNAIITEEQSDILYYLSAEEATGRCEALRRLLDNSKQVLVIQRRRKEDPAFRRQFARLVLRSKEG